MGAVGVIRAAIADDSWQRVGVADDGFGSLFSTLGKEDEDVG